LRPPSLRSQLNQIRLWVRQGRTDAWIAHKLDISVEQLEQFKREHLSKPEPPSPEPEPEPAAEPEARDEEPEEEREEEREEESGDEEAEPAAVEPAASERAPSDRSRSSSRRRGRRGGRRRAGAKPSSSYEGTFDHGAEGYGLWLDPAVAESQVYAEHWAGHRAVTVKVEADSITIRRAGDRNSGAGDRNDEGAEED
jgi:hypothetical protein